LKIASSPASLTFEKETNMTDKKTYHMELSLADGTTATAAPVLTDVELIAIQTDPAIAESYRQGLLFEATKAGKENILLKHYSEIAKSAQGVADAVMAALLKLQPSPVFVTDNGASQPGDLSN
jgi:hypothetical protein